MYLGEFPVPFLFSPWTAQLIPFGPLVLQVGYTDGHYCVTPDDKATALLTSSSLLYGEILPAGP